jgi:hypothetical protein
MVPGGFQYLLRRITEPTLLHQDHKCYLNKNERKLLGILLPAVRIRVSFPWVTEDQLGAK